MQKFSKNFCIHVYLAYFSLIFNILGLKQFAAAKICYTFLNSKTILAKEAAAMKVIDLTHTITENMPLFPGTEPPKLTTVNNYEANGFRETLLQITTHTGTHIDPPAHVYSGKATLDALPPEQFIGKALVINCRNLQEGEAITLQNITRYGEKAAKADFLLFNLGWDSFWGTPAYFGNYPCLTDDALDYILNGSYKGIGFDVMGIDPINDETLRLHKKLFADKQIVNIENLKNLHLCGEKLFWFSCFPLKIPNSDGSPIRAVAWFE